MDAGSAAGGNPGVGLSELLRVVRGNGSPPYANAGTGPLATNDCNYDAPIANPTGYHYLCFSPNALGGGLIAYGAGGGAAPLPLQFDINGTIFSAFPPFRVIASGTSDTATSIDDTVDWKSAATSAKTETLYQCTATWQGKALSVVDDIGTAATYPVAILPHAGDTILNSSGYVLNFNNQSVTFKCNGSGNWVAVP